MKNFWFIAVVFVLGWACSSEKAAVQVDVKEATEDSIEYELVVFDAGFESWYLMHYSKSTERSNSYYMNWNRQYISEWNHKSVTSRHAHLFDSPIDIDPNKDYGIEVNRKLFYYFLFVERKLGIPILDIGPKGVF